jgi:hypothetical protein
MRFAWGSMEPSEKYQRERLISQWFKPLNNQQSITTKNNTISLTTHSKLKLLLISHSSLKPQLTPLI